jgi:multidrug resistance efflux pump
VLTIGLYLGTQTKSFLGVAESRESHINFENPVEIRAVHVIPGKTVKKGELLIEVNQTDINQRLREANDSLQKLEVDFKLREKLNSIIQSENQSENDPLVLQLKQLKKEIAYLEAQKRNLYVFAEVDGVVGAVNFKKGERVPAFSPILTLSPIHPSFVQGYVNENIHTNSSGPTGEGGLGGDWRSS